MEQTSGGSGKEAERECEEEAKNGEDNPDAVNVSEVEVRRRKGDRRRRIQGRATSTARRSKSPWSKEDGDWKLDELTGFAKFDPTQLVAALAKRLEEEPEIEPQVAACIVEGLEEAPKEELENLVIENNTQPIVELVESCEGRSAAPEAPAERLAMLGG